MNGLPGAVGIGELISIAACDGTTSGIDDAIKASIITAPKVATISNTTDIDAGQLAEKAKKQSSASDACKYASGFAGNVQGGQNPVADIVSMSVCDSVTPLAVTVESNYDYL